jgi:hypothetical protein
MRWLPSSDTLLVLQIPSRTVNPAVFASPRMHALQVIAMICHFVETSKAGGPFLVMCPASVLSNWASELACWAPGLNVVEYKGSAEARMSIFYKQVSSFWYMGAYPNRCKWAYPNRCEWAF